MGEDLLRHPLGVFKVTDGNGNEIKVGKTLRLDMEVDRDSLDKDKLKYNAVGSMQFEGGIKEFDINKLLLNENLQKTTATVEIITGFKDVQNRIHKKKRVNKKWAKRYGYHQVPIYETKECEMIQIGVDLASGNDRAGMVEFKF